MRELENIRGFLTGNALTLVLDVAFSVIFIAVMFIYSVPLTLIVLVSLPLYVALSLVVVPILRARLNEKFARGAENQALLVETVTGIQTVKANALEPALARRWDNQLAAYVIGPGSGSDTIADYDGVAGNTDVITFAAGVAADQVWFRQLGNDLEVSIMHLGQGAGSRLVLRDPLPRRAVQDFGRQDTVGFGRSRTSSMPWRDCASGARADDAARCLQADDPSGRCVRLGALTEGSASPDAPGSCEPGPSLIELKRRVTGRYRNATSTVRASALPLLPVSTSAS